MTAAMTVGSVVLRAAVIFEAMKRGYTLMTDEEGLTSLFEPSGEFLCLVPADVMEFLIERDAIKLETRQ